VIARVRKWVRRVAIASGLVLVTILGVRAYDAFRAPPLKLWHTFVPRELDAKQIDAADWQAWLAAEDAAFAEVRAEVTSKLPAEDRIPSNRFFAGSPMHASHFATDWNHSYVLVPDGVPRGAVVLLHGLTDSPYSLRHVARHYRERGFIAVGVRMPGHGTVPAGLTRARWEDWLAATRLAARHARALAGDAKPLHIVGYSNGGALALKYALDAQRDATLTRPDQIVLISPMIGITSMARFAGVLGWPAVFPSFAKAAWLDTLPEYNPYKYNSFPVNGARQSSQLVRAVAAQLESAGAAGTLGNFPRILTFQSVLDSTVSTSAVFDSLYRHLPERGHQIVLFDRNLRSGASALLKASYENLPLSIVPPAPRRYSVTVISNSPGSSETVAASTTEAGTTRAVAATLSQQYPADFYSLSHVALPFPADDALYGYLAAPDDFGLRLGTVAVRGERGSLVVDADTLMRASCNPFFDYLLERIDATLLLTR
jgi:alpha-beta hydrolase superfamily lysophospholipase